jgi:dethiobiotin synthetase
MSLPGLFVTGTDTGVGKTRVAAAVAERLVANGRRVGVMKPVATGAQRSGDVLLSEDTARLLSAAGGGAPVERVTPFVFEEPLAPALAARRSARRLTREALVGSVTDCLRWWERHADMMIVEGIGGLLCPLADDATVADLAVALDFPLVIVARRGLGTLNHTLMTVEVALRRGLRIAGLVLNSPDPEAGSLAELTSGEELARCLRDLPVLTEIHHGSDHELSDRVGAIDWYERAGPPRWGAVDAS